MNKIKTLLYHARKIEPELDNLICQFHETHEPENDGCFPVYDDDEIVKKFISYGNRHNRYTKMLMHRFLEERAGKHYKGVYPAAGKDEIVYHLGGSEWFLIDRAYEVDKKKWVKRLSVYVDDKIEGLVGRLFPPRIHYIPHDLESSDFPSGMKPGHMQIALLRNPFGICPQLEKETDYKFLTEEEDWRIKDYENVLRFCVDSLEKGGILVTEPLDILFEDQEEFKAKAYEIIGGYTKRGKMAMIRNIFGIDDMNGINYYTYEQRSGSTKPRKIEFTFFEKLD